MNAEQFLSLADALRSYAQHSGRDINASNLFVHSVLMHAIQRDRVDNRSESATPRRLTQAQ